MRPFPARGGMTRLRALLCLLLAGSAVLAGCVAAPEAPGAAVDPAAALPLTPGTTGVLHGPDGVLLPAAPGAARAVGGQYSIGVDATEPTLGVDAGGNVYMTGFRPGVRGSVPTIMKSLDKGQTFEDVGPRLPTGHAPAQGTFDPYVVVDRDAGRVFMDDIWPLSCGQLSFSDDGGASWTTNPYSCGNSQVNDHQTLGVGKPRVVTTVGYPHVVYRCVNNVAYAACAMSYNGGLAFTPQVPVLPFTRGATDCGAITGHLASDPEGRMFLATGACGEGPTVAVTEDDGMTWSAYVIDPDTPIEGGEHDVEIASDEAGNLYAVWTHEGKIVLSRSVDHGRTWTKARDVTAPGVTATMFAAVAAAGPGRIAFAYVGSTIEGGYEGKPTGIGGLMGDILGEPDPKEWHEATWNAYIGVVENALEDDFTIESVTANDPADPLARGLCGRTRCHGMNDFIDVEIDADGRPWAAFVDVCTQECVSDPGTRWDQSVGFVGTLVSGPSLLAAGGALPAILPPPAAAPAA